ncbi:L-serine ammonia-lyase [Sphingorhabdus sp.]|jgi:L-serine dehydratase|uniref:L-serine ammonia-lyase n=1 Tax=Sphingorhabdus sp. TaxID=1902408 RepID=UPI0035B0814E|nr:L-serine ammonia-lyase [Sphingomonadaceae bacterium]
MISVVDLFRIGIGPSSSHTVGPMRIVREFLNLLSRHGELARTARIETELQGSLALTGIGHGSVDAVIMGLLGFEPETIDPDAARKAVEQAEASRSVHLPGGQTIGFDRKTDIHLNCGVIPKLHPNGMVLTAYDAQSAVLRCGEYYSTGGGFFATRLQLETNAPDDRIDVGANVPFPFASGEELLKICSEQRLLIDAVVQENETAYRSAEETSACLDRVADAMMDCIDRGLAQRGLLPGSLRVRRRAAEIHDRLQARWVSNEPECLFDWLNLFAMAVNEENAAGGRVVTAPTNGAAGIIPAIMRFYCSEGRRLDRAKARRYLLTAGGIGLLYKQRASISGAEMGCQGEVGVACSMAAGGLAAVLGGTPQQVTTAAEIGMEHNLGLTCDPVGGLVQIPCIERNALAAVKAANAARLALHNEELPRVSLDQVIETMRQTGLDMSDKYKETSRGGLAINVVAC